MSKDNSNYYRVNASFLGWGIDSSLDLERVKLLDEFVVGKDVLDVGCGFGHYVDYLCKKGFNAIGVDSEEQFINKAKRKREGVFIKADAEKLPFKNLEFDTVLLFDILEHGDDEKILREAKRVTKERILVIVPAVVDKVLADSGVIFRHYIDKSHLREYQKENLENLAKKLGLNLNFAQKIHPLYNETIFLALFQGPSLIKKIIRKMVFSLLLKKIYHTEYFAVFEKK